MKTATPPKGVTARWVSRRITRSPESRAVISRGTSLSEMFASTPLYRKHLRAKYSSASEFRLSLAPASLAPRARGPRDSARFRAPTVGSCEGVEDRRRHRLRHKPSPVLRAVGAAGAPAHGLLGFCFPPRLGASA